MLNTSELIDITGIIDEPISTLGYLDATLRNDEFQVDHCFHVVPEDFHIPSDGIIGKYFMKRFRCNTDYETMDFSFYVGNQRISIPILEGPTDKSIVLPARSEVIRQFVLRKEVSEPQLVCSQELKKGVFIARKIINNSTPLLQLINTTNKVMIVRNDQVETESLDDYDVFDLTKTGHDTTRTETLMKILRNSAPAYSHGEFFPLCTEYAEIFALETDGMTINNFYTQRLRIKDDVPVFIKNYRIPHAQKDEINLQVENLLKNDFIEPSASAYNSPILLVPKPPLNGKKRWRMCLDYRQVNKKLIADKFPLPRIDEILDNLGKATIFFEIRPFSRILANATTHRLTRYNVFQYRQGILSLESPTIRTQRKP